MFVELNRILQGLNTEDRLLAKQPLTDHIFSRDQSCFDALLCTSQEDTKVDEYLPVSKEEQTVLSGSHICMVQCKNTYVRQDDNTDEGQPTLPQRIMEEEKRVTLFNKYLLKSIICQ